MRAHIIENGIVTNTIEVESLDFLPNLIDASHGGSIGDRYENGEFRPPEPDPEPIPQSCTRRQGRKALLRHGLLDDVEDAIAAITDPVERRDAQIEYEADTWDRGNAFLQGMWQQLGGSEEGLDDLFRLAVTL